MHKSIVTSFLTKPAVLCWYTVNFLFNVIIYIFQTVKLISKNSNGFNSLFRTFSSKFVFKIVHKINVHCQKSRRSLNDLTFKRFEISKEFQRIWTPEVLKLLYVYLDQKTFWGSAGRVYFAFRSDSSGSYKALGATCCPLYTAYCYRFIN